MGQLNVNPEPGGAPDFVGAFETPHWSSQNPPFGSWLELHFAWRRQFGGSFGNRAIRQYRTGHAIAYPPIQCLAILNGAMPSLGRCRDQQHAGTGACQTQRIKRRDSAAAVAGDDCLEPTGFVFGRDRRGFDL